MSEFLNTPIEYLKGVGNIKADILKKELEIFTFGDLLMHIPFRYVDKTQIYRIGDVSPDFSYVQVKGKFISKEVLGAGRAKRLVAEFSDGSGTLVLTWFTNFQWIEKGIDFSKEYIVFGKPTMFKNTLQITHPELEMIKENMIHYNGLLEPIYHTSEKLKSRGLDSKGISTLIKTLLLDSRLQIQDYFSETIIQKFKLPNRKEAIINIHRPQNEIQYKNALYRLKFEEIFMLQYKMLKLKDDRKHTFVGYACNKIGNYFNNFYNNFLPFELSNAQKKVIKEIRADMGSGKQMNRLLMGDVGSGKTIVAFFAALISIDNQLQTCLMAPTEILARQHFEGLGKYAEALNLNIALLTGSTKLKERKILFEQLEKGEIHLLIGTHALIESSVQFNKLGLVIIDEQHRFGVEQRSKLWNKNEKIAPHILVMSATPIPRTLALTIYGDLDTSIIDELPKGRIPIKTTHQYSNKMPQIIDFCKTQIAEGRQIYIVFPLIEESETLDLKALEEGVEELKHYFPVGQYKTSVVHGKMKPAEKEKQMLDFKNNLTQIMIATTVIEVGVDVPNASVMLIENAERFGLTQLHQLRGRVGRGANQSYCVLISSNKLSEDARIRLDTMCRTNNGFEIAEVDLKLRGHGDIYGTKQSGIIGLKLTEITKDGDLITYCRDAVKWLLKDDFHLTKTENRNFRNYFISNNKNKNWFNIS